MKRKNSRIKKSRHLHSVDCGTLFHKREERDIWIKDHFLRVSFPDCVERQTYIRSLIKGFDEEPVIPEGQFTR